MEDLVVKNHPSSILSSRNTIEEVSDDHKELEEHIQETNTLNEVLTKLRQTQNSLTVTIADLQDDISDFQALMNVIFIFLKRV